MSAISEPAPAPFEGFGPHSLAFYRGLEADNSKAYWLAHKKLYDVEVAGPLRALAEELAPRFGEPKVFRPYRDIRFSPDKTPYKEHASFGFFSHGTGGLYFQYEPSGMLLAGGLYDPARDQLERFRDLQDDPKATASLDALLAELDAAGFPLGDGAPLKTAPRGRDQDHPRIHLLRRTMLTVSRTFDPAPWFFERQLLDRVAAGFETIGRWNTWLAEHVGPSEKPLRAW
ncbi:MAG TPA: DUF2461 domain-containing protein [Pseudolysinimonas sp.]|jgi:uncharacterized protein (TIGR02453 family)